MLVNLAKVTQLTRGTAKLIHVEGLSIAVFNVDGAFYALEDACPFNAPLSRMDGSLEASSNAGATGPGFFFRMASAYGNWTEKNIRSFRVLTDTDLRFCRLATKIGGSKERGRDCQ